MTPYQRLSLIQFFFILICGISVLDYGVATTDWDDPNELGFNEKLLEYTCPDDGCENDYWGLVQFWGYCIIIVGLAHFVKVLTVKDL